MPTATLLGDCVAARMWSRERPTHAPNRADAELGLEEAAERLADAFDVVR